MRATNPSDIDWKDAGYKFLTRFAYVDIFGSVIARPDESRKLAPLEQWGDALSHVLQPRFLFPNKAALWDSEVYFKLAYFDPAEELRQGTSISVGYMAENYADLGFPGMLVGIGVLGLLSGASYLYFMTRNNLPWMLREGTVLVLVYAAAQGGVEVSLPKILGSLILVTGVYVAIARFGYPRIIAFLDRSASGQQRPTRRR
jgi:hypothetical protein